MKMMKWTAGSILNWFTQFFELLDTRSSSMDKKKWDEFNAKSVDMAKESIRLRIHETSEQITKEIPHCPLEEGNILVQAGNPVNRIISVAEKGNYDLVIMGTHGHGKLEGAILGSVAGGVISRCSKPVLVIRLPDK